MIFTLMFASLIQSSLASGPCGGAQVGFWNNPDASRGGSVAMTAKVQAGAFIASGAQVCESAQVKAGAKILDQAMISGRAVINPGAEISGRAKVQGEAKIGGSNVATKIGGDALVEGSAMVTGNTQVIARAKVRGSSKVHNAVICQASLIEGFDVIDSDYYCQTEDPEPQHPGELGKKTLLGVDSDRDGVRDDVEIWINDTYSNTPTKNLEGVRIIQKETAELMNQILKMKDVKTKVYPAYERMILLSECHADAAGSLRAAYDNSGALDKIFLDTPDRFLAMKDSEKHMVGLRATDRKTSKEGCLNIIKQLKDK